MIEELIHLSSVELNEMARKRGLKGRGSMSKADKIIALAEGDLSERDKEIIRMDSRQLYAEAKRAGVKSYSTLTQAQMIEALVLGHRETSAPPEASQGPQNYNRKERQRAFELARIKANRESRAVSVYLSTDSKSVADLYFIQSADYSPPPLTRHIKDVEPD